MKDVLYPGKIPESPDVYIRDIQADSVSLGPMADISLTKLQDLLISKLGNETAENRTTFIGEKIGEEVENETQKLATKEDLANTKVDLIRWVFAFWMTLALMIIGLYLKK